MPAAVVRSAVLVVDHADPVGDRHVQLQLARIALILASMPVFRKVLDR